MKHGLVLGMTGAAMVTAFVMALAEPPWRLAGTMGMRQFVVVEPAVSDDADALKQVANDVCVPNQACVVLFWVDDAAVPGKMPMTQAQEQAVVAEYFRNPATGSEELLLKCRADEPAEYKCLR